MLGLVRHKRKRLLDINVGPLLYRELGERNVRLGRRADMDDIGRQAFQQLRRTPKKGYAGGKILSHHFRVRIRIGHRDEFGIPEQGYGLCMVQPHPPCAEYRRADPSP